MVSRISRVVKCFGLAFGRSTTTPSLVIPTTSRGNLRFVGFGRRDRFFVRDFTPLLMTIYIQRIHFDATAPTRLIWVSDYRFRRHSGAPRSGEPGIHEHPAVQNLLCPVFLDPGLPRFARAPG